MNRKEALQQFTQAIIDGEPYGDSPEAFEQWLEDKDIVLATPTTESGQA